MAETILAAMDQKRGASERAETKWSFYKTPLTYRWLTRFRSMLSSAFLNKHLTKASPHYILKVYNRTIPYNRNPWQLDGKRRKAYELSRRIYEYELISVRSAQTLKCSIVLWTFCELNVHVFCCCVSYFLIYILSLSSNNGERVIFKNIFVHFLGYI